MDALYIATRTVHYASAMLLFGGLVFVPSVIRRAWKDTSPAVLQAWQQVRTPLLVVAFICAAAGFVSGAVWIGIEVVLQSGTSRIPIASEDFLWSVLAEPAFGSVWLLRLCLLVILTAMLPAVLRSIAKRRRSYVTIIASVIAATYLATIVGLGHSITGHGPNTTQLLSDVVHLLAAGTWLGALVVMPLLFNQAPSQRAATRTAKRFSKVTMWSVSVLVLSGLANTWHIVGSLPTLIGTDYGRLLLLKVVVFIVVVTVATAERFGLVPKIKSAPQGSRNLLIAWAAFVAAIVVLTIAQALALKTLATDQPPTWPFAHTFSWRAIHYDPAIKKSLPLAGLIAYGFAAAALAGAWQRRWRACAFGTIGAIGTMAVIAKLFVVPAYPTTYMTPPVSYSVDAIAHGSALYSQLCSACHGRNDHGLSAATLDSPERMTLIEAVSQRRPGDLFWVIGHGQLGTAMPAFSPVISDTQIWDLIHFLRATSDSRSATSLTSDVQPTASIVAPDFTFELPASGHESLHQQQSDLVTLVVLYSLPQSAARLRSLFTHHH
jgi:putative copper resistance protein D